LVHINLDNQTHSVIYVIDPHQNEDRNEIRGGTKNQSEDMEDFEREVSMSLRKRSGSFSCGGITRFFNKQKVAAEYFVVSCRT